MWKKLSAGGETVQCGWLKDKYEMSWQIVLGKMLSDSDSARSERVLQAVLRMKKLDIKGLKKAYGRR